MTRTTDISIKTGQGILMGAEKSGNSVLIGITLGHGDDQQSRGIDITRDQARDFANFLYQVADRW